MSLTCGFYRSIYHCFTIQQCVVSIVWMVTTLWLLIKTSMEKINGIFTSGTTHSILKNKKFQIMWGKPFMGGNITTPSMLQAIQELRGTHRPLVKHANSEKKAMLTVLKGVNCKIRTKLNKIKFQTCFSENERHYVLYLLHSSSQCCFTYIGLPDIQW